MLFSCVEICVFLGYRLKKSSASTSISGNGTILYTVVYSTKAKLAKVYVQTPGRAWISAYHGQEPISSMLAKLAQSPKYVRGCSSNKL